MDKKLVANIDYIEFQSKEYHEKVNKSLGGLYLISTESFYKGGICKIGIASNFHKRFHAFKSCYGWYEGFYIFGLIPFNKKTDSRTIEKKLLEKFNDIRIIYPFTERSTEWLLIDVEKMKNIFSQYSNSITKFDGLVKAPEADLSDLKVLKVTQKGTLIEFPDGSKAVQTGKIKNLWSDTSPEKLKDTNPLMIGSNTGMTQAKYNKIWHSVKDLYTPAMIKGYGGTSKVAKHLAEEQIRIYQAKQRDKRSKRN